MSAGTYSRSFPGLSRRRLLVWLTVFLVALLVPTGVLVYKAMGQLKWEVFHQHQMLARDLTTRIDERLQSALREEERRPFSDYSYEVAVAEQNLTFIRRSPLAGLPSGETIPGLIGYFQVDPEGVFSTPLLPARPISPADLSGDGAGAAMDLAARQQLAQRLQTILLENQLLRVERDPVEHETAKQKTAQERRSAESEQSSLGRLGGSVSSMPESPTADYRRDSVLPESDSAGPSAASEKGFRAPAGAQLSDNSALSGPPVSVTDASRSKQKGKAQKGKAEDRLNEASGSASLASARAPSAQESSGKDYVGAKQAQRAQAAFDQLNSVQSRLNARQRQSKLGRVEELDLRLPYASGEQSTTLTEPVQPDAEASPGSARNEAAQAEVSTLPGSPKVSMQNTQAAPAAGMQSPSSPQRRFAAHVDEKRADNVAMMPASPPGPSYQRIPGSADTAVSAVSKQAALDKEFGSAAPETSIARIRTFESELDPLELSLLGSGQFVLFRKAWRDGSRFVQGALIERKTFVETLFARAFETSTLAQMSNLVVAYEGDLLHAFSGLAGYRNVLSSDDLRGVLLYRGRLSKPFSELELIYTITRLPSGPGAQVILTGSAVLFIVLIGGVCMMYRLGAKQIDLSHQQQDFVSAVSHELKTPLTSIRMYGEMLREGWASEDRKRVYYDYIHDESERLSRLIDNVLQLARMTRNDLKAELKRVSLSELHDGLRSKIASQVERAGFELTMELAPEDADTQVLIDTDFFSQIVINLVDNAIKFSARAENARIDIGWMLEPAGRVRFSVRDYGPGVPPSQVAKIFRLFYRSENELTRETVGTGIGLALVNQLARAMGATVDVCNREPGAEFSLYLAGVSPDPAQARKRVSKHSPGGGVAGVL